MVQVVARTDANTQTESSATGTITNRLREEVRGTIHKTTNAPSDEYGVFFTGFGLTGAINKFF